MRLDRVYIDGFKNLKDVNVDFDKDRLTTVLIGQNGAGKSNLIEAIVEVFRSVDLKEKAYVPKFVYDIDYRINGQSIRLSNKDGKPTIFAGESVESLKPLSRKAFDDDKANYFPDLVFGYYSGGSRRLESLFDRHQRKYYDAIKLNDDLDACREALVNRRLFYCRPIHGVFALLAFYAYPAPAVANLLEEKLGITQFDSVLTVFRKPWFAKGAKKNALNDALNLWGAKGPAGWCGRKFRDLALHPLALMDRPIDDYRDKGTDEPQFAAFFRNAGPLKELASQYEDDRDFFAAIEAMDISDLIRDVHLWVDRTNNDTGDVSFNDLSDGERQLLMVLGLIRVSRGRNALFLLDEPDTHLNPHWQLTYLDLVQEWTEVASDESDCHIILTSHNPLTIAALDREEVRVMTQREDGTITAQAPYTHPRGLGFTATLTEIFGLESTLDPATQEDIDTRNSLAAIDKRTKGQEEKLIEINDELNRRGFMFEDREPLYNDFLKSWHDVQYANRPPMTPEQLKTRREAMNDLIKKLIAKKAEGES
ncbi:AAA family ATPase [Rhodopirellula baltica]|uniref:Protein containing RecF/RecN/SMC protein n=1 Tax=Rhodopirellula baltica SWK14 TaxID=993516 RepID=L7CHS3_RHOBT|nr:AAA family ATPase [Rhodopirellula baltica]ELP33809.1 protein containing RecF/RecN/SMC protein [Rhodopirellula baltica SWK14]